MRFVWFWTFWHWSKESYRDGSLLRGPLVGVAGHWDEWFRHEASAEDLRAIEEAGRTKGSQRRFIAWLLRTWAREVDLDGYRTSPLFVLHQLAPLAPFSQWSSFERYRAGYGLGGVSAIVLAEGSHGEASDVRPMEAVALPAEADPGAPAVTTEGFQADAETLNASRAAALSLLSGTGRWWFIALWLGAGRRPLARWLRALLGVGWLGVALWILYLVLGPEPGERLFLSAGLLTALWAALVLRAVSMTGWQVFTAWRGGRKLGARLERSHLRLSMDGGLTLQGGSAGLPFALNILMAIDRAGARRLTGSWLWRQLFRRLRAERLSLAATGDITPDGRIKPVVVQAKIRACMRRKEIARILTPWQSEASRRAVQHQLAGPEPAGESHAPAPRPLAAARVGFAAEKKRLRVRRCRHLAQAAIRLGDLACGRQLTMNVIATAATCAMLVAIPDLRGILLPPTAPAVVRPASPSPSYLWVSLDTRDPRYFFVALESGFWLNRRVEVAPHGGANASVRAEIHLQPSSRPTSWNEEHGTVWVERRHRFLSREYLPGERVGRYSLSYLKRLGE